MEIKCEYCGSLIPDDVSHCPNCGGPNNNMHRSADNTPKTIAELEQWYKDRGLPPYEVTRFFIGIDYREPKAFGIYQNGEKFIVYKNKADGSRAIRYSGTDEDYAVNELYLKLKSEILNQKEHQQLYTKQTGARNNKSELKSGLSFWAVCLFGMVGFAFVIQLIANFGIFPIFGVIAGIAVLIIGSKLFKNKKIKYILAVLLLVAGITMGFVSHIGRYTPYYYNYHNTPYVYYNHDWYYYDYDLDHYHQTNDVPFETSDTQYRVDGNSSFNSNVSDFTDSSYYSSWADNIDFSSSSSSDHDYDWDSGSDWDSDWSDWDSDW